MQNLLMSEYKGSFSSDLTLRLDLHGVLYIFVCLFLRKCSRSLSLSVLRDLFFLLYIIDNYYKSGSNSAMNS